MVDHGTRYRMVTTQDGREHVSSVVLSRHEVRDILDTEETLLRSSGWQISHTQNQLHASKLIGQKRVRRIIEVRAFTPLQDTTPNLGEPLSRQT